jgi:uncharacterized iron-regulated protein
MRIATFLIFAMLTACAVVPASHDWEAGLRGDALVLLGEVHDNAEHHRQRATILRRAFIAGWRPAIAMEQFDRERQKDIDRARRERPRDVQHVIDLAAPSKGVRVASWNWDYYRPFVELALEFDVPLLAANLSNADTGKIVRDGYAAVFDEHELKRFGLDKPIPSALLAAQEQEIALGHCNALPSTILPAMARGQMARDAVMASILAPHASRGVVLIAGNGHVRRDIGVLQWVIAARRVRALAVGFLERGKSSRIDSAFDVVVLTAAAERPDLCAEFIRRLKRK